MDRYSKIILTVIALLLALHLFHPFYSAREAKANSGVMDVNIVKVADRWVGRGIPVDVIE
jgi:hypothetical protein